MRPIPKFWSKARAEVTDPGGQPFLLEVWGWSVQSLEDAGATARERVAAIVERVRTGQGLEQWYYDRLPMREPTLSEHRAAPDGELLAVVTRNRYGAEVLNTSEVLIADVDLSEPTSESGSGGGVLARLFGRRQHNPAPAESAEALALQEIGSFAGRHPRYGVHVYRTRAGLRVFVTGVSGSPRESEPQRVLAELRSDPIYVRLCAQHENYRARLTPKPWRVRGVRSLSVPWPYRSEADQRRAGAWVEQYQEASAGFAVCERVGRFGVEPSSEDRAVLELHDRLTGADSGLPLA